MSETRRLSDYEISQIANVFDGSQYHTFASDDILALVNEVVERRAADKALVEAVARVGRAYNGDWVNPPADHIASRQNGRAEAMAVLGGDPPDRDASQALRVGE